MAYSADRINLFITYYSSGMSLSRIAKLIKVTRPTLYRWIRLYKSEIQTVQPIAKPIKKPDSRSLGPLYANTINLFVANNPGCTLKQIADSIQNKISLSSICKILQSLGISHKRISIHVVAKDIKQIKTERQDFANNLQDKEYQQAIFVDETGFCVGDHNRYGYSHQGQEIKKMFKHKRNKERYTVISAIKNTGEVLREIHQGTITAQSYVNFFFRNQAYFTGFTVYQDNARIHHAKLVKTETAKLNVKMKFIPAYSPEFNPIELLFSEVKKNFRKLDHQLMAVDIVSAFNSVKSSHINKFYLHALEHIKSYRK